MCKIWNRSHSPFQRSRARKISGPLTSTSYTAVGSGFDLQGVPAEKPRNLLTHPPSESVGLLGLLLQCENIYLGPQMVHWTFAFTHIHHGKIIFKKVIFDLSPYA